MSNDLSNQLRSLNTFEWMARPATTKQICFDAADRIEKLEAALLDLCDGWECCAVSRSMRAVARKALEGKSDT